MTVEVAGSLEGIIALAQGRADLAGCHLWDPETQTYNQPYLHKLLPGRTFRAVALAHRRIGFITPPGNPLGIQSITDLTKPGVRFCNRQNGSGTRVWLDHQLTVNHMYPTQIDGYQEEKMTHTQVAQMVGEGKANVGIGIRIHRQVFPSGLYLPDP